MDTINYEENNANELFLDAEAMLKETIERFLQENN